MTTIYRIGTILALLGACFSAVHGQEPEEISGLSGNTGAAVLIDHAVSGSIRTASNYEPGVIPPGIGIPHTLINALPEGDYYAVVFFEGLPGCPSNNYVINAFRANAYWGYDVRESSFSKAVSSSGGGCMQQFHIDPSKGDDWLWGALSNTGTSSALADTNNIPAFAICVTKTACDPIVPHGSLSNDESPPPAKVSNVLFLPGIKGSDLYEDNPLCLIPADSCGVRLWLPIADAFVPELFLDAGGKSKRPVFVREGDILARAFNEDFYTFLTKRLDDEAIWKAMSYDWRLSLPDLITNGIQKGSHIYFDAASGIPYMERTLQELASTSPSGKVTIIAHSNGGLVAKALMTSLGDTRTSELIDSVILVGVPQSGAPRALGALLYGDSEGIPGIRGVPDVIFSAVHAREFALNSPMAYHLLPSARYLSAIQPEHPLIQLEDTPLLEKARAAYGQSVDTEQELDSFARAAAGDRIMPANDDLTAANILNAGLLAYAKVEHSALDVWQPPQGVQVYQLSGYGIPTISGIDLYPSLHNNGTTTLSYRPMFTQDGDGTVPVISGLMMNVADSVHQIWLDLPGMHTASSWYSHANLFEAPDVEETIADILHQNAAFPATAHAMEIQAEPVRTLQFFVHSPVRIVVADQAGERTSVGKNQREENIPGSTSGTLGEVKYVVVPSSRAPYTLSLDGEGSGTFTLDMLETQGDEVIASSTIADVPVNSTTKAILTIGASLARASQLIVDEDGDGSPEFSITPLLGSTVFPPSDTGQQPGPSLVKPRRREFLPMKVIHSAAPLATEVFSVPTQPHRVRLRSFPAQEVLGTSSTAPTVNPTLVRTPFFQKVKYWLEVLVSSARSFLRTLSALLTA